MKVTNEKSSRSRLRSFDVNESAASGMLNDILQDCDAYLGGCSLGKGFQRAAQNYMKEQEEIEGFPVEDPFYVVDIGVVVSQVYQCAYYGCSLLFCLHFACIRHDVSSQSHSCFCTCTHYNHINLLVTFIRASLLPTRRCLLRRQVQPRSGAHSNIGRLGMQL